MALRSIFRLNFSSLSPISHFQGHFHQVSVNLICATAPSKGTVPQSQTPSFSQTRYYRRTIDVSHLPLLNFDFSEDLVKQEPLNEDELLFKYRGVPEIENLQPEVKKLFTVRYGSGKERLEHRHAVLQEKVVSLTGPTALYERQIAYMTVQIRNLIPCIINDRRNKKHKAFLYERIAKRKKMLGYLRRLDYDRFQWLLKELKIKYTVPVRYANFRLTKNAKFKKDARQVWLGTMTEKVQEVHDQLQAEKSKFLAEKEEIMRQIEQEAAQYGITPEEIKETYKKQLAEKTEKAINPDEKKYAAWKKLNEYIKQEKIRKEKEKWVY